MSKVVPRLKKKYQEEIVDYMRKEFGYKNIMQVPKLEKIVLNMGLRKFLKRVWKRWHSSAGRDQ